MGENKEGFYVATNGRIYKDGVDITDTYLMTPEQKAEFDRIFNQYLEANKYGVIKDE